MWRKVEALNRSYLKTGVAVLLATALSVWGIGEIPIHKMPFSAFWNNIAIRTISSLFWVLLIKIFYPGALARFTFRLDRKRLLIGLGIVAFLMVPRNLSHDLFNASLLQILEGFLFALFIGIDEDLFSRGLIFAAIEKHGVGIAAGISSIHFGLLHVGNAIWGGQSFAYTSGQIVTAAAFGYLCCGLMLYTGSIWVPVLFHGLSDLPMQFLTKAQYVGEVTGRTDWVGVAVESIIFIGGGWALIQASDHGNKEKLHRVMKKFGLLEEE